MRPIPSFPISWAELSHGCRRKLPTLHSDSAQPELKGAVAEQEHLRFNGVAYWRAEPGAQRC